MELNYYNFESKHQRTLGVSNKNGRRRIRVSTALSNEILSSFNQPKLLIGKMENPEKLYLEINGSTGIDMKVKTCDGRSPYLELYNERLTNFLQSLYSKTEDTFSLEVGVNISVEPASLLYEISIPQKLQRIPTPKANESTPMPTSGMLTPKQAAQFLNLKVSTIRELAHDGKISCTKPFGKKMYINKSELMELIRRSRVPTAEEMAQARKET